MVAEEIRRRFHVDMVRFGNSGTEVTMDALRIARGFTGRDKFLKFEGGYHGHHDDVLISILPAAEDMDPPDAPNSVPASAGIPLSQLDRYGRRPVQQRERPGSGPQPPPRGDRGHHRGAHPVQHRRRPAAARFLERVRDLATEHGAVLIFDEVKTGVVVAYGGGTERFGVQPDMVCLAKSIGGGLPVAALGGSAAVMSVIEGGAHPHGSTFGSSDRVAHQGTYNGNPVSMAAALATLTRVLTPDVYPELERLGNRLTAGCQEILDDTTCPAMPSTSVPRVRSCSVRSESRTTATSSVWTRSYRARSTSSWPNRGILLPPGPDEQWTLSVAHTDADVDQHIQVFHDFARELAG